MKIIELISTLLSESLFLIKVLGGVAGAVLLVFIIGTAKSFLPGRRSLFSSSKTRNF